MNFLKIGLLLATLTLFIVACTQTNPSNNATTAVNTANNRAVVVNATPAASQPAGNTGGKQTEQSALTAQSAETVSASETFKTICAKCHQESGEGGSVTINGKKLKVPNFKSEAMKNDSDEDFVDAITNGIPEDGMPAFKDKLNEEQIKNLVQYIRKDIQGK